jgi:hypothetical protein
MASARSARHRRALVALAGATITLALASPPAVANPPSLQTVGATGGLVTASWSLPSGVRSQFFEVAKYPDVNVYGYFRQKLVRPEDPRAQPRDPLDGAESQVRFGVLDSNQTSLTAGDPKPPLPAGVYYVHIAGHDACGPCPAIEFSATVEVNIGPDGNSISSKVVAPGTGGGVVAGDRTPPVVQLRYSKRQDIDKLLVRGRMSEPGTLTARATVDVGGLLSKIYTFRPKSRKVTGGVLARLPLKISKKQKRALKRAMRRGKRLRARVALTARDRAGNTTTKHATIRLKP